ncbi:MAG: hypothetical protein ACTHN5_17110 [Phycisphaerae bacterium]
MNSATLRSLLLLLATGICIGALADCASHPPARPAAATPSPQEGAGGILLDFEQPDPPIAWRNSQQTGNAAPPTTEAAPATEPTAPGFVATQPAAATLARSSLQPHTGLWSMTTSLSPGQPGELFHHFQHPRNLEHFSTVSAAVMHLGSPARSGEWRAAVYLVDEDGKRITGDPYALTTKWRDIPLDLQTAAEEGLDIMHVAEVGVQFLPGRAADPEAADPLQVQTDTWKLASDAHTYIGQKFGAAKSFYVQREGTRLEVGMVGQYELDFFQRAGTQRPWFTIRQKGDLALGQPGTGLMLLDQDQYDALSTGGVRQDAYADNFESAGKMPAASWPVAGAERPSEWTWECSWTSPVAAIVVVRQETGPYDALGQPAAEVKWRFMIYQWGQVFVHAEWTKTAGPNAPAGDPITWALVLDRSVHPPAAAPAVTANSSRLLDAIYPAAVRQGLTTALPDRMQTGAAVGMIAKTGSRGGQNWWWTAGDGKRVFGVGIAQRGGPVDCMLLANTPTPLMQAGSYSAYLVPPKVRVRQGEWDRSFPGDVDNDGLVEPYGFQVVRLQNGRVSFTLYPQERPLFYPPFLFTVPAVERQADDVKNSHMLLNIYGQQITEPPQFPDGSFLLQMPYVIDRPVQVEGVLVKK